MSRIGWYYNVMSGKILSWATILVVGIALLIRLANLSFNAPFIDEALYIVLGKKIILSHDIGSDPFSWISGMPYLYPSLAGLSYMIGGLVGARLFSAVLGITSVWFLYRVGLQLFVGKSVSVYGRIAALLGGFFLAIEPIHGWLSRMAMMDMLAFALFLGGLLLTIETAHDNNKLKAYLAGILFFLGFLAKYSVALMLPVVSVWIVYRFTRHSRQRALLYTLVIVSALVGAYGVWKFDKLASFLNTQTFTEDTAASLITISSTIFKYTWVWLLPGAIGLWHLMKQNRELGILLSGIVLVPVVVHLLTLNGPTLVQNLIFSVAGLCLFAGLGFAAVISRSRKIGIAVTAIFILFALFNSTHKRSDLEHLWPNYDLVTDYLVEVVEPDDRILVQADDIAVLALEDVLPIEQITGPYGFSYEELKDDEAYKHAVEDGYFTYIQLDRPDSWFAQIIEPTLSDQYELVYQKENFVVYTPLH